MNRVRDLFVEEGTACLEEARGALSGHAPDPTALHDAIRRYRGSAQLGRYGVLADVALTLERTLKPVARSGAAWEARLGRRVAEGIEVLARGLDEVRAGRMEQDEREPDMDEQSGEGTGATDEVVAIETLEYAGGAALEQALRLREPLEEAIVNGDPPGGIIDELFDLIQLGTK